MHMSMLGGGATTIPTLKRVPMSMLGGGGPSWDYKKKARSFPTGHSP